MGWTDHENSVVVREYFEMLARAARGESVRTKKPVYDRISAELGTRSRKGVEDKLYNISAVLRLMGWKIVPGLSPLANFQEPLALAVRAYVSAHPELLEILEPGKGDLPTPDSLRALATDSAEVGDEAQRSGDSPRERLDDDEQATVVHLFDLASGTRAKEIGNLGEEFVYDLEKWRLKQAGRSDLAKQVVWTARDVSELLGYDIQSFTATGSAKYIEVKSTLLPQVNRPFIISHPEVEASRRLGDSYRLSRVFDLSGRPRVRTISGPVPDSILDPRSYWGRIG